MLGHWKKTYPLELVRDVLPLWDQRDEKYHNRDLKPIRWDEIREKLNVTGKYWDGNTNVLQLQAKVTTGHKKFVPVIIRRVYHVTFTSPTVSKLRKRSSSACRSLDRHVRLCMSRQMLDRCVVSVLAPL